MIFGKGYSQKHGIDFDDTYAPVSEYYTLILCNCYDKGVLSFRMGYNYSVFEFGFIIHHIYGAATGVQKSKSK
jgi:hypothetical protein